VRELDARTPLEELAADVADGAVAAEAMFSCRFAFAAATFSVLYGDFASTTRISGCEERG
jgi:hypothetical protein